MRCFSYFLAAVLFAFLVNCAGLEEEKEVAERVYTKEETKKMTYCVGMTDNAYTIALGKQEGLSKADAVAMFEDKPESASMKTMVDKIYQENSEPVWDYTLRFFTECAANLAGVGAERITLASVCNHDRMVASVANRYKTASKPRQQVYAYFARDNKSESLNEIVDKIYSAPGNNKIVVFSVWARCMAKITHS